MRIGSELDLILVNLCITEMPSYIYRYKNADGIDVIYYTLDIPQLLDKNVFTPIYYHEGDISRLNLSGRSLFQKALKNAGTLLPSNIVDFSLYLEKNTALYYRTSEGKLFQSIIEGFRSLAKNEKIWCLTNNMHYGSALGFYQLDVLKKFCNKYNFSKILIGVGNRDFAYILEYSPMNKERIGFLLDSAPDFMINNGTLRQPYLFIYNNDTTKLTRIS